ncbi:hypothetical protein RP20_CCG017575 [Aedes albopictus]|nr:hypothetical protein RP20_CCG017575 [Aedes albopictus]
MRSSFILAFHLTLNVLASNKTWYLGFPDKRPFTVHTTRFLCAGHPNYTIVEQCKLKLHRNKPSALTFRATFLKPLEPVVGSMKIWYKTNVNIWRPLLGIDEWNHACDFLTAKYEDLDLMQKIYRRSLKHMLPHLDVRCPLQGTYEFTDFTFEDHMFPPFLPAGSYRNDMALLTVENLTVLELQFYGTVRAKGLIDLSMG